MDRHAGHALVLETRICLVWERAVIDTEGRIVLIEDVPPEIDYPNEPDLVTVYCITCHEEVYDQDDDTLALIKPKEAAA